MGRPKTVRPFSREAFWYMVMSGQLKTNRQRVANWYRRYGKRTREDAVLALGKHQTITAVIKGLIDDGVLVETGDVGYTTSGRRAAIVGVNYE